MGASGRWAAGGIAVGAGWFCSQHFLTTDFSASPAYLTFVAVLLAIGLYGATTGIEWTEVRRRWRLILVAVTLGVVAKAFLIALVMWVAAYFFHLGETWYIVLGIAVAQIDPLSVTATADNHRISAPAKTLLSAWAIFDDPVTVFLTIYFSAFAGRHLLNEQGRLAGAVGSSLLGFGLGTLANLGLVAVAAVAWFGLRRLAARLGEASRTVVALELTGLLVIGAVAVLGFWMFAIALVGLFWRPGILVRPAAAEGSGTPIERLTLVAFIAAAAAVGLVLGHDFSLVAGLLLGIAAFTAHALVSSIITSGMSVADRGYLALGQQNGVTAIVLALVLEPDFPGSAGVVATAIVVVNLLHAVSTAGWGRRLDARNQPAAPAEDGPATAVVREPECRESPQFT